jgi:DNA-binding beta-propeller fold protein YncE
MELRDGTRYEWVDEWATVPGSDGHENGRTHGVAVASDGRVVVFHQADPAVLVYDSDGSLLDSWGAFEGAHGLTLVTEGGTDYLWLTDQESAAVVKTTLDGDTVARLAEPPHPAYADGDYVPTWVAVDGPEAGGSGDIWVADGYGEGYVHRYDEAGEYTESIDGTEGAGAFDCPHGVWVDPRGDPALYVADRGNERVQVYDLDGTFERAVGSGALTSPCGFALGPDGRVVVPELFARVAVLEDGRPVGALGENEAVVDREDWPNVPAAELRPEAFNSPHDAAVDDEGNIYVVEWIVGGRVTKLERTG